MYDYRLMTAEQRREIVAHRHARGFPLHKPPHVFRDEGWYFITAATYEHRRHFSASPELTALERRLLEAFGKDGSLAGWVVFPNHYHILVHTSDLTSVGRVLGRVHGRSARYANTRDGTLKRHVWFKYSDRKIRSERHFWASLHYMVFNPVKHGYVERIDDWAWSCYHDLLAERGPEWMDDLMQRYPLRQFGAGWDSI